MDNEIVYSYINDIASRLKEPRKYGGVSLMIGAGFSKNASCKGLVDVQPPNWSELAEKMYDELYPYSVAWDDKKKREWNNQKIIKTSGKNVTKLAEEYIANFDRNKINNLIEQSVANDMFVPGELHKQLLKFPWIDVFTTNYDTLLEQTVDLIYRDNNYEIVYSQSDLPGSSRPRIIKLHGSIPQIKPYIICDEDYRTYPERYSALVNTVQQAMLETRLCLIGFSGDDPNFQSWLGWLRDNMGEECPQIYLIGIYDNLNKPEKKLLENKGITIVDLSVFVSEQDKNKYYNAFTEFFKILKKYDTTDSGNIYQERPYSSVDSFWKPKEEKQYIEKIKDYSKKVETFIQPYILLPEEQREDFAKYFSKHFQIILHAIKDNLSIDFSEALKSIIRVLRKCLIILEDKSAIKLEELCRSYDEKGIYSEVISEISLYLMEMYRIDGRKDEYNFCVNRLKKYLTESAYYYNEYLIEEIKNSIAEFDYMKAKELLEKMQPTTFEYKVKKAGFYKQLSQPVAANQILNELSAELAQMRLSDEVYASYLGYLNLCYRIDHWNIDDEYSDVNYHTNPYNTRQIIVKQREKLEQDFFEKERKKEETPLPFNLNSSKSIVRYFNVPSIIYGKPFVFIVGIDHLCLPLFSDQKKLLPRVIDEIIETSESSYWKMSLAVRSNNEKVINQIFTRKTISKMGNIDKKAMFDSLLRVLNTYNEASNCNEYFSSIDNILIVLSYLVVFLDDQYVIDYLSVLCKLADKNDSIKISKVKKILKTISTRFNSNIAQECHQIIFSDFPSVFCLARYFSGISFKVDENIIDNYYDHSIGLLESLDNSERDNGIAQLLILWKNQKMEKYKDSICLSLWKENNKKLPQSQLFYPFIWEELPYPEMTDFSKLYYEYLMNLKFLESVTKTGYISNNSIGSVFDYLHLFYMFSDISPKDCMKIKVDFNLAKVILEQSSEFLLHEKKLLDSDFDIMGEREACINKFSLICDLVSYVYVEAVVKNWGTEIINLVKKNKAILEECNINVKPIEMVEMIQNEDYNKCWGIFDNIILGKNNENYSHAFTGLQCLLYYLVYQKKPIEEVDVLFENFFNAIKYIDIEYARTLWIHIVPLLQNKFFMRDMAQKYVSVSIKKCIEMYQMLADKGERFYLDGLYNCITALHKYFLSINKNKSEISSELENCIEIVKNIENYEIKNIFTLEL